MRMNLFDKEIQNIGGCSVPVDYRSSTVAHRGSTKIFLPVQKYFSQYKNISPSTKIFIPVQKYLSQYKNIYSSTKIFIPVQKYFSSTKIFPVQIRIGF